MKKTKRYQDGGYLLDSEGKRVKSGSGEDIQTGSYDKEADMESARNKLAQDVQKKLKDDSDSARVSKDAEEGARAPTSSVKASDGMDESDRRREAAESAPKRQDFVKTKPSVVTKEELAKSGLTLREYMNKQQGKTARGSSFTDKAPSKTTPKAKPASTAKSDLDADQRKRSDMIVALTKAEQEATTPLAKQKIAESKRKMLDEYANAPKAEERKNYVPRATPGARAPKQTTSKAKPYMPEEVDMSFRKGGSVRGSGIAQRGVRKCKMV